MNNKKKIINDPVYGFITIPDELAFDIIEHRYFQRLRRIIQLGLTHLVYPGALHTRFQHAIGSLHLMVQAINSLRNKGHNITEEEAQGAYAAILLHDIGHGPFSHTLEKNIVENVKHEEISHILINQINNEFNGKLKIAIEIYHNTYPKKFLHQLVSSQLDVDRLDYLKRDSFYTGVSEGVISTDRIIKMLNVSDDELVVEAKGIYSVEKFIIARRLMYWQVYLHKTVLAAEYLLHKIIKRAKELSSKGVDVYANPTFKYFLVNKVDYSVFANEKEAIENFATLDDFDILSSIKQWINHSDRTLRHLSQSLIYRKLPKIELQNEPFDETYVETIKQKTKKHLQLDDKEIEYFVHTGSVENNVYTPEADKITIIDKKGRKLDISEASDQLNLSVLSKIIKKYFLCYPKEIYE